MSTVISVENVSKLYRLGSIGGATLKEDFSRWWAKRTGKPDPLLRVDEGHKSRLMGEDFWALRNVNFQVREGEVLGIIGRNGAGKSTLLKILSQVTSPTSGEIKIKGRIASLLEVGTGFHHELTGRENIFLNGAILGMTKLEIRKKFDEIVAFSGIEEFIDTPVKRYSSGMYVRLAFAVAAHLEPEILIVDEVLAVGDAEFQRKCLGKMGEVAKGGRTVLFVSHNMSTMLNLCSSCLLMDKGQIEMIDSSEKVVAAFLGKAKHDFCFSRSDRGYGDHRVTIEGLEVSSHQLQTGSPFSCVIHVYRPKNAVGKMVTELALDIVSEQETKLIQLFSHNSGQEFEVPPGKSSYCVELPCLPLVPGRYSFTVWAGYGHTTFDLAQDCYSVTVDPGSYPGGPYIENRSVPIVPLCHWRIVN